MNALSVALKDLQMLLKDRGQVLLLFLVPIGFILAFSAAYSAGQNLQEQVIELPVVNHDAGGDMSALLLEKLNAERGIRTEDADEAKVQAGLADESIKLALIIPAGFSEGVRTGAPAQIRLLYGDAASDSEIRAARLVVDGVAADLSLETQLVGGLGQMAAMMSDAPKDVQVFTAERIEAQAASQFERAKTAPLVALAAKWPDQITQGQRDFNPSAFGIAGFAIMFAFLTAQATSSSVFDEKKAGTFRRLMASPLTKRDLLIGKMLPNFVIAFMQVVIIAAASYVLLPLLGIGTPSFGHSPLGLLLITAMVALCSTALGWLLAGVCRTESQVGGMSSAFLWVAAMVGGAFIPAFVLSDFLNTIGKLVPHYWALQAYNDLMIRNQGLVDILPELGILAAFTAVFAGIGLLKFKFE